MVALAEASLSHEAASNHKSQSRDTKDSETSSDTSTHLKVVAAALAGVTYDFWQSTMMKTHLRSLEYHSHYFPKGYGQPLCVESVPEPQADEAVFEDFFTATLRMPPHLVLLDILCKFQVQLHQLMPNANIQINKFILAITSYRGRPTTYVFTQQYELHYHNKKIQLVGSESTLDTQFGYITFDPSRFASVLRHTPAMRNKWTGGWDGN
jgi:hypothetical protein